MEFFSYLQMSDVATIADARRTTDICMRADPAVLTDNAGAFNARTGFDYQIFADNLPGRNIVTPSSITPRFSGLIVSIRAVFASSMSQGYPTSIQVEAGMLKDSLRL